MILCIYKNNYTSLLGNLEGLCTCFRGQIVVFCLNLLICVCLGGFVLACIGCCFSFEVFYSLFYRGCVNVFNLLSFLFLKKLFVE
jgi:hypothetical protein